MSVWSALKLAARPHRVPSILAIAALGLVFNCSLRAATIVSDTWIDGERTQPASPAYSENGVDSDGDGNIESAWFRSGDGTMSVVNANPGVSPGVLRKTLTAAGTSSATWLTYFTPDASPVTLANANDQLKVTWVFTPTLVNTSNTNQNFRIAVVDTSAAARISTDTTTGSDAYPGYAMFLNFGQTTGRSTPYQLLERNNITSDLLSTGGNWTNAVNAAGFGTGAVGYTDGNQYTFTMTFTRNADNSLTVASTMSGGNINSTGSVSVSTTDTTPNTFTFDTFALRPSGATTTATQFDTSLFKVEVLALPEPFTVLLAGLSLIGVACMARRRNG
jgi:hypothetical protein